MEVHMVHLSCQGVDFGASGGYFTSPGFGKPALESTKFTNLTGDYQRRERDGGVAQRAAMKPISGEFPLWVGRLIDT